MSNKFLTLQCLPEAPYSKCSLASVGVFYVFSTGKKSILEIAVVQLISKKRSVLVCPTCVSVQ